MVVYLHTVTQLAVVREEDERSRCAIHSREHLLCVSGFVGVVLVGDGYQGRGGAVGGEVPVGGDTELLRIDEKGDVVVACNVLDEVVGCGRSHDDVRSNCLGLERPDALREIGTLSIRANSKGMVS